MSVITETGGICMKRALSVLLALSLALCLTGGALAEVTLERIGSALPGTMWVYGTPELLSVGTRNSLGLMLSLIHI